MSTHLVFVYGTLRSASAGAMSIRFPNSKFISDGQVRGKLYDLGAYPGMLLDESGPLVVGEVYEVDDETLNELDRFEAGSNYVRKQFEVSLGNKKSTCWTYEPKSYCLRTLINSGDWIEYARTKTDWSEGAGAHETRN
jgi:gamma-glutamylcyclotransferase (GGCT)/AIG2-like uncharacterized protein YtfP